MNLYIERQSTCYTQSLYYTLVTLHTPPHPTPPRPLSIHLFHAESNCSRYTFEWIISSRGPTQKRSEGYFSNTARVKVSARVVVVKGITRKGRPSTAMHKTERAHDEEDEFYNYAQAWMWFFAIKYKSLSPSAFLNVARKEFRKYIYQLSERAGNFE